MQKNPFPGQVFFCKGSSQIETFQKLSLAAVDYAINSESIFPANSFTELCKGLLDVKELESRYREPITLSKSKNIFQNFLNIEFMLMST